MNLDQKHWPGLAANVVAPLIVAVVGIAVAVLFKASPDHLPEALVGWVMGWLFTLIAIAGWENLNGRYRQYGHLLF